MIKLEHLSKQFVKNKRRINVINDFNYEFQPGKLYLIKGESGKGKTTLLTLLAFLQKEDGGKIIFNDIIVSNLKQEEKCNLRRKEIGIVFQDYNLFDNLTVMDNVIIVDVLKNKIHKEEIYNKAKDIIKLLGLEDRINHYPYELSGGEQQRVGIARAILKDPSILICDEPVSNLDKDNAVNIVEFIDGYCHNKNKIVIVASHDDYFDDCADYVINL
ncbi:ATP-binding cassette domain-containing protein [Vallitalea sp.]|jgi:ABC-type lipoprotein export system ATPase subunit|uniref:ATP-binding cassette domain-containing protein n=1 Tax=Vallitalea sp. TaxID=1882829 RepID=UPI0025D2D941|nr:ATP-binding cassette domain-containing protein [Vallitalea sp.]MCT4687252.1 ATP-binding cassette domain-containing protein [Vallitalea sp.]